MLINGKIYHNVWVTIMYVRKKKIKKKKDRLYHYVVEFYRYVVKNYHYVEVTIMYRRLPLCSRPIVHNGNCVPT